MSNKGRHNGINWNKCPCKGPSLSFHQVVSEGPRWCPPIAPPPTLQAVSPGVYWQCCGGLSRQWLSHVRSGVTLRLFGGIHDILNSCGSSTIQIPSLCIKTWAEPSTVYHHPDLTVSSELFIVIFFRLWCRATHVSFTEFKKLLLCQLLLLGASKVVRSGLFFFSDFGGQL